MNLSLLQSVIEKDCIFENELLSRHTSLKIGGPARFFVVVKNIETLKNLMQLLVQEDENYYILGNGSNILVSDEGYDGVIITLAGDFDNVEVIDNEVIAGSGALLSAVSKKALEASLTGLEYASGIPGSIGGALVMNAGAYGGEMKQVVTKVEALIIENGNVSIREYNQDELNFDYRNSFIKQYNSSCSKQDIIIALKAHMELVKGDKNDIKNRMDELAKERRLKQPLEYPSAGSTFKRPEGYFAGKLISDAGLKGYKVGGAKVSEKHAGFCINEENATAADFYKLMEDVSNKVFEAYNVKLEPEVILLGKF